MCGLAGIVDFDGDVQLEQGLEMNRLIEHRGPDDSGYFAAQGVALVHRRLAIIDLSENGHQPMADDQARYWIVYNGEIYNYRELRAQLSAMGHRFRSKTDTEVVLRAYTEWGERTPERLSGMWAFAIWDAHKRELFCSRDRFGIKPFYYHRAGSRLVFASELKALCANGLIDLTPNVAIVRDYLEQGYVDHTAETFLSGVFQLPPAHSLTFGRSGLRIARYWSIEPRDPPAGDPVEAFRACFVDSVRNHLQSDVPIGTCLSGGLDSSAIACVVDHLLRTEAESAAPVGERQKTFTAHFPGEAFDEKLYAEAVVAQTKADPHWVTFSTQQVLEELPAIVRAQDEPFRSTSIIAQWFVMKAARDAGVKVLLDGQGGDELLAGYDGYFGFHFADLLLRARTRELLAEIRGYRTLRNASVGTTIVTLGRPFAPSILARVTRSRLLGTRDLVHPDLGGKPIETASSSNGFSGHLKRQLHLVLERRLPELLHYEDRNSMAHSLEARVPFLDHRLAELAFSLDARHLIERGRTKIILRRALSDLMPARVAARTDKLGFATPETQWLRGGLGELAADVFASQSFAQRGFVNASVAQRQLLRHRRGECRAGSELWRALNLELWAEEFLTS